MLEGLDDVITALWQKPVSAAVPKKVDSSYKAQLFTHPPASSLLTSEMQGKQHPGFQSSPADKEGRKMDRVSRKVSSSPAINLCIANCAVIMGGYQLFLWGKMSAYFDLLPDDQHQ